MGSRKFFGPVEHVVLTDILAAGTPLNPAILQSLDDPPA